MLVKELVNSCAIGGCGKVKLVNRMNMDDKWEGDWDDIKATPLANFEVTKWVVKQAKANTFDFILVMEVA